jgi:hypothetical protein
VIVILCGFVFVLLCVILLGVGLANVRPHARKGMERPISRGVPVSPGWAVYHIPALALSIASCATPVVDGRVAKAASKNHRIQEYAGYRMTRSPLVISIIGYWLRGRSDTLESLSPFVVKQMKVGQQNYHDLTTKKLQIGGYPGQVVSLEIPYHQTTWVRSTAIVVRRNQTYYFQAQYPKTPKRWGQVSFDYMLKSVTFD